MAWTSDGITAPGLATVVDTCFQSVALEDEPQRSNDSDAQRV